jgi:hypothetical protein
LVGEGVVGEFTRRVVAPLIFGVVTRFSLGRRAIFAPLRSLDWQVHVYGQADAKLHTTCREQGLPFQTSAWSDDAQEAGLERDALYLVRPDGYVALAASGGAARRLTSYRERLNLRFQDVRRV